MTSHQSLNPLLTLIPTTPHTITLFYYSSIRRCTCQTSIITPSISTLVESTLIPTRVLPQMFISISDHSSDPNVLHGKLGLPYAQFIAMYPNDPTAITVYSLVIPILCKIPVMGWDYSVPPPTFAVECILKPARKTIMEIAFGHIESFPRNGQR